MTAGSRIALGDGCPGAHAATQMHLRGDPAQLGACGAHRPPPDERWHRPRCRILGTYPSGPARRSSKPDSIRSSACRLQQSTGTRRINSAPHRVQARARAQQGPETHCASLHRRPPGRPETGPRLQWQGPPPSPPSYPPAAAAANAHPKQGSTNALSVVLLLLRYRAGFQGR